MKVACRAVDAHTTNKLETTTQSIVAVGIDIVRILKLCIHIIKLEIIFTIPLTLVNSKFIAQRYDIAEVRD